MDINKIVSFKGIGNNLNNVIDKGFAGDVNIKFSLLGKELISVEARVVGASVEKFINYASNFKTIIKDIAQNGRVFYVDAKYSLIKNGLRFFPNSNQPHVDKEMISEIVAQVVGSLTGSKKSENFANTVDIKTDFHMSVSDKSKEMYSNIEGIDVHQEEHIEDTIDNAVEALKKAQKRD
ncbi:MAG: hypothetical protein HQK91_12015 [Nitrospirae bacterium]|nr:hypothetical protein [Nitrospirota bacterium]MBF0542160.1 hypothetical protein [Nitrospirota bacterium]